MRTVTTTGGMRREENGNTAYILVVGSAEAEMLGGIVGDRSALVAAALRDPEQVGWALQLFAGEPTPMTLYKVFEVILGDVGGQMVTLGWTTKAEIDRFTGTVHSVDHLGIHARHGVQKYERLVDDKVMSVREMRAFIRGLLVKWLESKRT